MQTELQDQQKLLLWLLAIQPGGGMFLKDVGLSFKPASRRTALVNAGLTEEVKQKYPPTGRSSAFVKLTDKGWEWCQDHLSEPIETRSPRVKDVLNGVFQILSRYFNRQDHCCSLGDLILQSGSDFDTAADTQPESKPQLLQEEFSTPPSAIRESIREACLEISGGQPDVRVRLADLRKRLTNIPRKDVDDELLAMEREGTLSAWQIDNPDEITDADRDALLLSPAGTSNHIVYYGGSPS